MRRMAKPFKGTRPPNGQTVKPSNMVARSRIELSKISPRDIAIQAALKARSVIKIKAADAQLQSVAARDCRAGSEATAACDVYLRFA
jgi:hypothetical protein